MKNGLYIFTVLLVYTSNLSLAADAINQNSLDKALVMAGATTSGADINEIDTLLKLGANPNARLEAYASPLIFATLYKDWVCADRLLEDPRTNPNVHDNTYGTPLLYAVVNGNYELAKQLISRGAKVDIKGGRLSTHLRYLIEETQCQELISMMPNEDEYYRKTLLVSKNEF
jgi:ankyrin repeat protein